MESLLQAGQSVQPLVCHSSAFGAWKCRLLLWGGCQNSRIPSPHHPRGWESRAERVQCALPTPSQAAPGRVAWAVLTCSTRAGGCHIPWPSPFLGGSLPLPAAVCSGKEGSGMAAWQGWLPGGLSTVSPPGMPVHRPSRVSLHPREPGGIAGRGSESLAVLLHLCGCCMHQILCRHVTQGRAGPFPASQWLLDTDGMWGKSQVSEEAV